MKFPKKMQNARDIKPKRIIVVWVLIIFGVLTCLFIYQTNQKDRQDVGQQESTAKSGLEICKDLAGSAKQNLDNGAYKGAYDQLIEKKSICEEVFYPKSAEAGTNINQQKAAALQYYGYLAISLYRTDQKSEAKRYANKVIKLNKSFNSVDREAVSDQNQLMADMFLISEGLYINPKGGKKL